MFLLVGCVEGGLDEGTVESDILTANKLSANKLSANKLSANKLSANKLAASSLETRPLMSTADGREVMSYIVSCALPAGTSVTLTDSAGISYTYPGSLGLAPGWATTIPTVSERRWVSACVLARTNLYGLSVQISMRNPNNAALAVSAEEDLFKVREAAFYGDLFAATPVLYACANQRFANSGDVARESLRACARSTDGLTTECGFTFTGYCSTAYLDGRPAACGITGGSFVPCVGGGSRYAETITTFLK